MNVVNGLKYNMNQNKPKRKYTTPRVLEEQIENQILYFLELQDVSVEKVSSE